MPDGLPEWETRHYHFSALQKVAKNRQDVTLWKHGLIKLSHHKMLQSIFNQL